MITPLNAIVDKYTKAYIPETYTYDVFLTEVRDGFDESKVMILYQKFDGRVRARKSSNIKVQVATHEILENMIRTILTKLDIKTIDIVNGFFYINNYDNQNSNQIDS